MNNLVSTAFLLFFLSLPIGSPSAQTGSSYKTIPTNKWVLINIPINSNGKPFGELLGDDLGISEFGSVWTMFGYDGEAYYAIDLSDVPISGASYWLIQTSGIDVEMDIDLTDNVSDSYVASGCIENKYCRALPSNTGNESVEWNMLGTSFSANVEIDNVRVQGNSSTSICKNGCELDEAAGAGLTSTFLFSFDTDSQQYVGLSAADQIQPWQGFWFVATESLEMLVPDDFRGAPVSTDYYVANVGVLNDTGGKLCGDDTDGYINCELSSGQDPHAGQDFYSRSSQHYLSRESGEDNESALFDVSTATQSVASLGALARSKGFALLSTFQDSQVSEGCLSVDNTTGLAWETKTNDGGLQDRDNAYTWYDPELMDSPFDGAACGGGINCDTHSYISELNTNAICGVTDWRLPTVTELMSILNFGERPSVSLDHFTNTPNTTWYWTETMGLSDEESFTVSFSSGSVSDQRWSTQHSSNELGQIHVLAVSGGQ